MTAQKGDSVILKVGDGSSPTENFANVGGLIDTSFRLNNRVEEASNLTSGKWRRLISEAGIDSVTISGSGFFTDTSAEETLRGYAFSASENNYELHFGNGDKLTGAFIVSEYIRSGKLNSQEDFYISLESSGAISFVTA